MNSPHPSDAARHSANPGGAIVGDARPRVFIVWGGQRSRAVALAIRKLLEVVVQGVNYFVSTKDVAGGEIWQEVLKSEWQQSTAAIAVLTSDNLANGWIHFECGAIARSGKVFPLCVGIQTTDVPKPLGMFQGAVADEAGLLETVAMVNDLRPVPDRLTPDSLRVALAGQIQPLLQSIRDMPHVPRSAPAPSTAAGGPPPPLEAMIRETLEGTRELLRRELRVDRPPINSEWRSRPTDGQRARYGSLHASVMSAREQLRLLARSPYLPPSLIDEVEVVARGLEFVHESLHGEGYSPNEELRAVAAANLISANSVIERAGAVLAQQPAKAEHLRAQAPRPPRTREDRDFPGRSSPERT